MAKHLMMIQIIRGMPRGWAEVVQAYVDGAPKNSFYLSDVARELKKIFDVRGSCLWRSGAS